MWQGVFHRVFPLWFDLSVCSFCSEQHLLKIPKVSKQVEFTTGKNTKQQLLKQYSNFFKERKYVLCSYSAPWISNRLINASSSKNCFYCCNIGCRADSAIPWFIFETWRENNRFLSQELFCKCQIHSSLWNFLHARQVCIKSGWKCKHVRSSADLLLACRSTF